MLPLPHGLWAEIRYSIAIVYTNQSSPLRSADVSSARSLVRTGTSALLFLLLATVAGAQTHSGIPPLVEKVNVTVINVDVTVTRKGEPVADLTPADFEVFEDGKPQKITNFYVVDHAVVRQEEGSSVAATPAAPPPARFRRKAVLLVDNHFIDKHQRDAALAEMRKFIDTGYGGQYDWSIGSIGGGVHMLMPFTSDKKVIGGVLDRILGQRTIAPVAAVDASAINHPEQVTPFAPTENEQAAAKDREARIDLMVNANKEFRFFSALDAMRKSASAVIEACRALSPVEGKKLLVLISSGMEIENRVPEVQVKSHFRPATENYQQATEIREAMVREANASDVNIYIINAAGVASPISGFDVSDTSQVDNVTGDVRDLDSFPHALASETGGMYLTSNTISQSIKTIDTFSSTYYSLGYKPSHFEDGKYHKIEVRVKKPGYKVLSRSGYLDDTGEERLIDSLKVAVGASVRQSVLPIRLDTGPKVAKGRGYLVPITAMMPLNRIVTIRQGNRNVGRVHVYVSVFNEKDENVGFEHISQDIHVTDEQLKQIAAAPDSEFRYTVKVELGSGNYNVVIAVRDEVSEEIGKIITTVDTRG